MGIWEEDQRRWVGADKGRAEEVGRCKGRWREAIREEDMVEERKSGIERKR